MARRQATGFSLSVSRAREYGSLPLLPPSFLVPVSSLARTFARPHRAVFSLSFSRSLIRSFVRSPLHSAPLVAGSPPPSRARYSLVRSPPVLAPYPPPAPPDPRTHHRYDAPVPPPRVSRSLTLRVPEDAAEDPPPSPLLPRDAAPRTLHGYCERNVLDTSFAIVYTHRT